MCENTGLRDLQDLGSSLAIATQHEAFVSAASKNFISAACDKEPSAAPMPGHAALCDVVRWRLSSPLATQGEEEGGVSDTAQMIRNPRLCTLWPAVAFRSPLERR